MEVEFLQAFNGDSIVVSFTDSSNINRNILIDGGPGRAYQYKNKKGKPESGSLKNAIDKIREKNESVDLLIITHVDDDHIGGILRWFEKDHVAKDLVQKVWFNSGRLIHEDSCVPEIESNLRVIKDSSSLDTSIKQGIKFEDYIEHHKIWDRKLIKKTTCPSIIKEFGLTFTILSPDGVKLNSLLNKWSSEDDNLDTAISNDYDKTIKELINQDKFTEDTKPHNGSSIAFILTHNNKNMLFLGDAHPSLLIESLKQIGHSKDNPIKAEFMKVSHHGSKSNTNYELLELVDTDKYIISSNGDIHKLPHKKCLARIINHNKDAELLFNYKVDIFSEEDTDEFQNFKCSEVKTLEI
jgi:ribonuclease BN (tRNA processing enzyme)